MILLRVIPEGQWRHIIFTALFYENIHGRYCACIQKRNNEHSHSFLIIVFKMKISSFSSVYNKLGLNSLLCFCHAASEQDERDHRPTSNEFFQASSVSSCVILLRVIPEGQWRHTLFTALFYENIHGRCCACLQKGNNDHCHNYSLPSSRWKVRHFLLSRINKDARAKMRVSWIRSTISLQQMSKSNILNSCHYGCRLNYSYSSLSTFWTSNLSLAMLIIGDC